jgi:hypothetical protein
VLYWHKELFDVIVFSAEEGVCKPDPRIFPRALERLGVEPYELERERVQLAILKLSEGDIGRLQRYVEVAKADYRDVLAWAEYPEQTRAGAAGPNSSPETLRAIRERDRRQVCAVVE